MKDEVKVVEKEAAAVVASAAVAEVETVAEAAVAASKPTLSTFCRDNLRKYIDGTTQMFRLFLASQ